MNKILSLKTLIFLFALVAFANSQNAFDRCCPTEECCQQEYNCGDPLNCGSVNFLAHVGVAPTTWRNRGDFSAISCNAIGITNFGQTVIPLFELPNFRKFFHVPWIVGGQIGWALNNNMELYVEGNFRQATHRNVSGATPPASFSLVGVPAPNSELLDITFVFLNKFRATDAYVGVRYYWGRYFCDRVAFFLGGKFGLVHHKSICFNYSIVPTSTACGAALTSSGNVPFFLSNTSPASGLNLGFDWCFNCGWSVVVMAEVVAACGPKSNGAFAATLGACDQSALPTLGSPTNLVIGGTGTELFFPITIGLKYSF